MKKILKPASLLLAFLMLIGFFIFGILVAKITGAAEGQGLAGGAIVLFYGLVSGGIALVVGLVLAYLLDIKYIKMINWILTVFILLVFAYLWLSAPGRNSDSNESPSSEVEKPDTAVPDS